MNPPFQKLSVLVPFFNESENLRRYPAEVFSLFKRFNGAVEYIFIDDGSTDESADVVKGWGEDPGSVRLVRHEKNRGLGAALRSGFAAATGDALLTLDADLTFHPREAENLLAVFDSADCVLGSPFLGRLEGVSGLRKALSWGANAVYRALLGAPITSATSIFRLYRASALKSISLRCESFDINAEIVFRLLRAGARMKEVPATLASRTAGHSKIHFFREIKNHLKMYTKIFIWRLT